MVAWGSTLNMWTTRHGRLIPAGATVAQVDLDGDAIGVNRAVDGGVVGDLTAVAAALTSTLDDWSAPGWRTDALRARIAAEGRWRDVPFVDDAPAGTVDPRTLTVALDDAAARGAHGGRRLGQLHGLSGDVPVGAGQSPGSASRRPSSRSDWGWRARSAPRSPDRTG